MFKCLGPVSSQATKTDVLQVEANGAIFADDPKVSSLNHEIVLAFLGQVVLLKTMTSHKKESIIIYQVFNKSSLLKLKDRPLLVHACSCGNQKVHWFCKVPLLRTINFLCRLIMAVHLGLDSPTNRI